ncbi:MAG: EamA family transporter [Pseudonocardiales bacterium]
MLLALAAAVAYGTSDFIAGLLSRRASYLLVGAVAQVIAMTGTLVALPFTSPPPATAGGLAWGAASGAGAAVGTLALYRGLAAGQMAVAAPLSGVGAAALPAVAGFLLGERPSVPAIVGIVLALPAVWLVSSADRTTRQVGQGRVAAGVVEGLLAGVGFAVLFVALDRAGGTTGLWPVAAGQVTSAVLLLAAAAGRVRTRPGIRLTGGAAAVGGLGASAIVLFFFATHRGPLTFAAVLASLYPAVTVLLARLALGERMRRLQTVGLALAGAAVVLIVTG